MGRNASVENVLQEKDFDKVWDYLETKFGYSKEWRTVCYQYIYERSRHIAYKPNPVADFYARSNFVCLVFVLPVGFC